MTHHQTTTSQKKTVILTSIATSLATVSIAFLVFAAWFQKTQAQNYIGPIEENRTNIVRHDRKIKEITKNIDRSTAALETEIRRYIDHNYGELSKRDENVAKLIFLYNQQDKRLSSIETVLTKY